MSDTPADTAASQSPEDVSKDRHFARVAEIAQAMIADHGKDFAMGTLVLAARWIADGRMDAPKVN